MATLKEIKSRIRSITNTGQITRAMKMVAAANLRHVQASMGPAREYAEKTEAMLADLFHPEEGEDNFYVKPKKDGKQAVYVLIVGNRGLCGVYNIALVQYAKKVMDNDPRPKTILTVGKWGKDVISNMGIHVDEEFPELSENPRPEESRMLAERLKELYRLEETQDVCLICQSYVSALKQEPCIKHLFPLGTVLEEKLHQAGQEKQSSYTEYYFEPGEKEIRDRLIETCIDSFVLSVLKEAKCAEHTARMTAMTNANDNIDELLSKLQSTYNRVRQEGITNEISEIVGGTAALKNR